MRGGHSHKDTTISVRGETYDQLRAAADRRRIPVAWLVEETLGDPATWQTTADRIRRSQAA